ncbi:MAG: hypothetical protein QY316_06335 [Thermodesulfobacteriota bacterium]|nr:MAG: hypothetical protein QY316_06335 [Thermodesulfobacteriota bacterium]
MMSAELKKFIDGNITEKMLSETERLDRAKDLAARLACSFIIEDNLQASKRYARLFKEADDIELAAIENHAAH